MAIYRARVAYNYPAAGGPGYSIFHLRTTSDDLSDTVLDAALDNLRQFYADMASLFPTGSTRTFDGELVDIETQQRRTIATWSATSGSSPNYLPLASAIVVGWRTTVASRSGTGRTFLGPLATTVSEANGTPTATALTTVRDAADDLIASSTGPDLGAWGVYSPTENVIRDFVGSRVRDTFAVLRSRRD